GRAGVLRLPLAQLIGRDRGGERAARLEIWDEHGLVRAEDGCSLGHEVDAAEHDRVGVGLRGLAREAERVTDVVSHVLHVGHLVVVREDDCAALTCEGLDLVLHSTDRGRAHSTSIETSRERAEWVSAPTETKSTPVSAIARTVSSVTPPEASSTARPLVS